MPKINLKRHKQPRVQTISKREYQNIYNTPRWKKLRKYYIHGHPFCESCLEKDKTTLSKEVHHIIPFATRSTPEEQEDLAFDCENLVALCIECHKAKHCR